MAQNGCARAKRNIGVRFPIVDAIFGVKREFGEIQVMCGGENCDICLEGNMVNISKSYKQRVQIWACDNCGNLEAIGKEHRKDEFEKLLFTTRVNPNIANVILEKAK